MTHFIKRGNLFDVASNDALDVHKTLPVGNYTIYQDPNDGKLYLEMVEGFTSPKKVYGATNNNAERILSTFGTRTGNTGVLLAGEKGSGKTLLSKEISILAAQQGIPTILINRPYAGDGFNTLIQNITQPCIILIDEFEKTYKKSEGEQDGILTLMDGVYQTNKLFILTVNNTWQVSEYMKNRPGRIFYYLDFKGLDRDFIAEYCEDCLNDKSYLQQLCNYAAAFDSFNFDMLKAIVEEMNRYNESPEEATRMLNVRITDGDKSKFNIALNVDENDINIDYIETHYNGGVLEINPFSPFVIEYMNQHYKEESRNSLTPVSNYSEVPVVSKKNSQYISINFTPADIIKVDNASGKFTFYNKDEDAKLVVTRTVTNKYSVWDAL